jgi:hypothetical protein
MDKLRNGRNLCVKETNVVSLVRIIHHHMVISSKLYQGDRGIRPGSDESFGNDQR